MQHEGMTTEGYAEASGIKSETIRRAYCVNGHYLGVKPRKLPNGRLVWPADEVRAAIARRQGEAR